MSENTSNPPTQGDWNQKPHEYEQMLAQCEREKRRCQSVFHVVCDLFENPELYHNVRILAEKFIGSLQNRFQLDRIALFRGEPVAKMFRVIHSAGCPEAE